jgi:hypothetical protein
MSTNTHLRSVSQVLPVKMGSFGNFMFLLKSRMFSSHDRRWSWRIERGASPAGQSSDCGDLIAAICREMPLPAFAQFEP